MTHLGKLQRPKIICPFSGALQDFELTHDGYVNYWTYTLTTHFGDLTGRTWTLNAPRPTKFHLANKIDTWDLRKKDRLRAYHSDCGYNSITWATGFMFKHGIVNKLSLVPSKYPAFRAKLDSILSCNTQPWGNTELPSKDAHPLDKGSFIKGYLAADNITDRFKTADKDLFDFFVQNHGYAGLVLTGKEAKLDKVLTATKNNINYTQYVVHYAKGANFTGFKVFDITDNGHAKLQVYQLKITGDGSFSYEGGWTGYSD